jgi:hypothetical protein
MCDARPSIGRVTSRVDRQRSRQAPVGQSPSLLADEIEGGEAFKAPGSPLPRGVLVHLCREQLIIRDPALEDLLAVAAVGDLVTDIQAGTDQGIGIEIEDAIAADTLDEAVRRQRAQQVLPLRRVRRTNREPGCGEQIFAILHDLLRSGAGGDQDACRGKRQDWIASKHICLPVDVSGRVDAGLPIVNAGQELQRTP